MKEYRPGPNILDAGPPLSLVLVGKTGHGKSSTASMICGQMNLFPSVQGFKSKTKKCQMEHFILAGREVTLVDTPGNFDTRNASKALEEIGRAIYLQPKGYDAILLILRHDVRLTDEEIKAVDQLKKLLGGEVFAKYAVIVFTRGDTYEREYDILSYINVENDPYMNDLVGECKKRCILVNNKLSEGDSFDQVKELFCLVDRVRKGNCNTKYTNEFFEEAGRQSEGFEKSAMEKRRELEQFSEECTQLKKRNEQTSNKVATEIAEQKRIEAEKQFYDEKRQKTQLLSKKIETEMLNSFDKVKKCLISEVEQVILRFEQNNQSERTKIESELQKISNNEKTSVICEWSGHIDTAAEALRSHLQTTYRIETGLPINIDSEVSKLKNNFRPSQNFYNLRCEKLFGEEFKRQTDLLFHTRQIEKDNIICKLKTSVLDIDLQWQQCISDEAKMFQNVANEKILSLSVPEQSSWKKDLERIVAFYWIEIETSFTEKLNITQDNFRDAVSKIKSSFDDQWSRFLRELTDKGKRELRYSLKNISEEVRSQMEIDFDIKKFTLEEEFKVKIQKETKGRQVRELQKYMSDDTRECVTEMEEYLKGIAQREGNSLDFRENNMVISFQNQHTNFKDGADAANRDLQKHWIEYTRLQKVEACCELERVCKNQVKVLEERWKTTIDKKHGDRKRVLKENITRMAVDYKTRIMADITKNIKASEKRTELISQWETLEREWENDTNDRRKRDENEWLDGIKKDVTLQAIIGENLYDNQENIAKSSIDRHMNENRDGQEELWDVKYLETLNSHVGTLEREYDRIAKTKRLLLDETLEENRSLLKETWSLKAGDLIDMKQRHFSDILENKRNSIVAAVERDSNFQIDDVERSKQEWKDASKKKKEQFVKECLQALSSLKAELEQKWRFETDLFDKQYKDQINSEMYMALRKITNRFSSDLRKRRQEFEKKWQNDNKAMVDVATRDLITKLDNDGRVYCETVLKIVDARRETFEKEKEVQLREDRLKKEKEKIDELCQKQFGKSFAKAKKCFCPDSYVINEWFRSVKLDSIQTGQYVLCYDFKKGLCFSPVYRFGHQDRSEKHIFVKIETETNQVLATPNHHIHVGSDIDLHSTKAAIDVSPGDTVHVLENKRLVPQEVSRVTMTTRTGLYAPYTLAGTILVDEMLASCYVDRVKPAVAHRLLAPLRMITTPCQRSISTYNDQ